MDIRNEVFLTNYADFAKDISSVGAWSACEQRILILLWVVVPPLATYYRRRVRRRKFLEYREHLAKGEVTHYVWMSTEARVSPG